MAKQDDPTILFVKPSAISGDDKARLTAAGVIVIEIEDPQAVKFVRAHAELPQNVLLEAATKAISYPGVGYSTVDDVRLAFAENVCRAIASTREAA